MVGNLPHEILRAGTLSRVLVKDCNCKAWVNAILNLLASATLGGHHKRLQQASTQVPAGLFLLASMLLVVCLLWQSYKAYGMALKPRSMLSFKLGGCVDGFEATPNGNRPLDGDADPFL